MSKKPIDSAIESSAIALAKKHKERIMADFAPTFCFDAREYIFPTSAEEYTKDVLTAKMKHYEGMISKTLKLNNDQINEYQLIKENFFNGGDGSGKFDMAGFEKPAVKKYIEYENSTEEGPKAERPKKRSVGDLLTFDEKRLGYPLGKAVPITGHPPDKNNKVKAPVYTSYVPTEDGAIIRYECFYALSGAIPGTNWLYKLLPEKLCKVFGDFAVHAGDWEGVYVKVKIDEEGQAKLDHIQTFSHGRSGARKVDASQLTYREDGSPCIFVGSSTHHSYTDNFVGRNQFIDIVGDKFTLRPKKEDLVDLSPDPAVQKPAWTVAKLWGRADLMTHKADYVKSGQEYTEKQTKKDWLKYDYHPISESRIVKMVKSAVKALINVGKPALLPASSTVVALEPPARKRSDAIIERAEAQQQAKDKAKVIGTMGKNNQSQKPLPLKAPPPRPMKADMGRRK